MITTISLVSITTLIFEIKMLEVEHGGIAAEHSVGGDNVKRAVSGDKALDMGGDILAGEAVVRGICRFLDDEIELISVHFLRIP